MAKKSADNVIRGIDASRTRPFDRLLLAGPDEAMALLRQRLPRSLRARLAGSLVPGGFLFLGHAETLRGLSHDFHLEHTHDTFYYRRRGGVFLPPHDGGDTRRPAAKLAGRRNGHLAHV